MSSVNRFLSASAASWVRILLTMGTQILLVPVFLSRWSVEEYGCWLIIQTIVGVSSILSTGYQNFQAYEFLKVGDRQLGRMQIQFYSALPYAVAIALLELVTLSCLIFFGFMNNTFDPSHSLDPTLLFQTRWSLILYSVSALISSSVGGLAGRAVAPYGHFPRMTWWGTLLAIVQAVTSGVAAAAGANLLQTVLCIVLAGFAVNIPIHLDMWRIFQRNGLHPVAPDWKLGFKNVVHSLAISLSTVLDISRQQGVRIFLGAIIGVTQMTAFATMRTMSNLSLQGIGTITNPIMPEIMRFLREKDTSRTGAATGFVWFFAVMLLAPVLIVFQWLMPIVFHVWTRGKIAFNPVLFGLFSIALLVYSVARPSVAVLQGNNLLKVQLYISVIVSALAVGGILVFTSPFGVAGAAASLLLAESVGTILSVYFAWHWLETNGIGFPWRLFAIALTSIAFTAASISMMIYLPGAMRSTMVISVLASCVIVLAFVQQLPAVALQRVRKLLHRPARGTA